MPTPTRKLLLVPEHEPYLPISPESHSGISSNNLPAQPKNKTNNNDENHYLSSGYGGFSGYRLNEPFDTSMVLTVLVLLTAIFFMGFFSMYMRRFSAADSPNHPRFRRRRPTPTPAKGVDPDTVESLPVYSYSGGAAKQGIMECAICLSEFEEGEGVKGIPYCGHVFHVGCIEMWLEAHVTCPLCRTARLLPEEEEVRVGIGCDAGGGEELGSTVEERDTWRVGPERLRRCGSCSRVSERDVLRRSLSF